MLNYLIVFLGAGFGGAFRHGVNLLGLRLGLTEFPFATFFINVSGSLIMGLAAGYFAFKLQHPWAQHLRLFMTTGILGGYTTFSTFSLEAVLLFERGAVLYSVLYAVGSVILGILGLVAGLALMRTLS